MRGNAAEDESACALCLARSVRPQLLRPRDQAAIAALGQRRERLFETTRMEFRVALDTMPFVQDDDCARFRFPGNPIRDRAGIAPDRVEPANRPAHQRKPTLFELRVDEQIFQAHRRAKVTSRPVARGGGLEKFVRPP